MTRFTFLFLIASCAISSKMRYNQVNSDYSQFLEEKKILQEISILYAQDSINSYCRLIEQCNKLNLNSLQLDKNYLLHHIYNDLNDFDKSNYHLKKAIHLGYVPKNVKGMILERRQYLSRIDTSTLRILRYIDSIDQDARTPNGQSKADYLKKITSVDSITLLMMDSLIKANNGKWLGLNKIGNRKYNIGDDFSHDIAVHHMEEEDNHRYFNLILKACKEGNEDWSCAEGIKWQQLRRFVGQPYTPYDYMKLRRLKINNDLLDLEDDETLMTINVVSKLIRNYSQYGKKAVVYPTILIKDKDYNAISESLITQLKKFDIVDEVSLDTSTLVPMDSLEKIGNDYPFVVKIMDK